MTETRSNQPLGYQAKLARFQKRKERWADIRTKRTAELKRCNREALINRILSLQTQAEDERYRFAGKLGSQAAKVNKLKETVAAQELIIRHLRHQIAVLRKIGA